MTIPPSLILYVVLVFFLYFPGLFGPFIFDDEPTLLGSDRIRSKKPWYVFTSSKWRGLTAATWAFQHMLSVVEIKCIFCKKGQAALKPWGFRAVNYLIHAANGYGVSIIAGLLGLDPLIAGLLFVIGPFPVYGVSYISGRTSILSGSFGILGTIAFLSGFEILAVPAVALAFFAKEDGIAYAGTFMALSFLMGGYWWMWPIIPIGFIVSKGPKWILKELSDSHTGANNMVLGGLPGSLSQPEHGITQFIETLVHYPLWAFGFKQAPYHGSGIGMPSILKITAGILILFALIAVFLYFPDFRILLVLLLIGPWMLYIAVPTMDILMEYRNYFSAVGVALILSGLSPFILVPLTAFLGLKTWINSYAASSGLEFWKKCIKSGSGEKSRAWQELAGNQQRSNNIKLSEESYLKALELNPGFSAPRQNLAWLKVNIGEPKKGLEHAQLAVQYCPLHSAAWNDLGGVAERNEELLLAADSYRKSLELTPGQVEAWNRLGVIEFRQKKYIAAREAFGKARFIEPKVGDYIWNWAQATRLMGKEKEATAAMKLLPNEIPMTNNMVNPPDAKIRVGV